MVFTEGAFHVCVFWGEGKRISVKLFDNLLPYLTRVLELD